MPSPFLHLTAAEILARVTDVASAAAGFRVVARVGEEAWGVRNVGVDLPRAKTREAGVLLRRRVALALEAAHVVQAPSTMAPRVEGTVRGQVRVEEATGSTAHGGLEHLQGGPRSG